MFLYSGAECYIDGTEEEWNGTDMGKERNLRKSKILSVVIPVYNEEHTVTKLLDRVCALSIPGVSLELLVVNDGSTDATADVLRNWAAGHENQPGLKVVIAEKSNGGKGSAVREGIRLSTGDVLIVQDADLEYDPADYAVCIAPILNGEAKIVYGSREDSNRNRIYSSPFFYLGALSLTFWINLLCNSDLTDEPTCYKTFDGNLIRSVPFEGNRFDWEPEITVKLLRLGYHIHEVIVTYRPRSVAEGKKIRLRDGFEGLWTALKWRFLPLGQIRRGVSELSPEDEKTVSDAGKSTAAFWILLFLSAILHALLFFRSGGSGISGSSPADPLLRLPLPDFFQFQAAAGDGGMDGIEGGIAFLAAVLSTAPVYLAARVWTDWKRAFLAGGLFLLSLISLEAAGWMVPGGRTACAVFLCLSAFQVYFTERFLDSGFGLFLVTAAFFAGPGTLLAPVNAYWLLPVLILLLCLKFLPFHLRLDFALFSLLAAGGAFLLFRCLAGGAAGVTGGGEESGAICSAAACGTGMTPLPLWDCFREKILYLAVPGITLLAGLLGMGFLARNRKWIWLGGTMAALGFYGLPLPLFHPAFFLVPALAGTYGILQLSLLRRGNGENIKK